ncbi:N-acetylneuraminate synthase family protein [Pseudomonadota bacterium]|mgnify:CR=1 FL=1|jgi:N-acetylneuraminate synthase|nr:N-acetylneuraminate synthase family protein [Pseudomonadota bacterium]
MNEFKLGNRMVGSQHPPLVIAEIGINHNGSLESAISLADDAIDAGIEVIKHQTHVVEDEMTDEAKSVIPGNSDKSIYAIMKECALNEEDEISLKEHVESRGKIFISTPFSRAAADRLEAMGVCGYKIGSGECNNYPLIEHIAAFKKPIILSTGMNDLNSIYPAVEIFRKHKIPYALLHTTNIYPTPNHLVRLGAMTELQENFDDAVVGLSDHTITNHACFGAVALGASILERHFTDSMTREGPDIVNSMDPSAAQDLIMGANIIFQERGGSKGPVDEELPTIKFAFASVVSIDNIKQGEIFSKDNLWVKRPGTGEMLAEEYESILGKRAMNAIPSGQQLKRKDIE